MELIILLITLLLFAGYAALIIYYRICWHQIIEPELQKNNETKKYTTKVTVIIAARNEALNIAHCLRSITAQTYPVNLLEVIVVDDHSIDDTALVVQSFNKAFIQCIFLNDYVKNPINSYKKKAIEIGIAKSNGELIVTTDADCFMGKNWLTSIVSFYEEKAPVFIAAPVLINTNNSFLSIFQSLDFMTLQGITGAAVNKKMHNMCNGANLAYTKKAFLKVGGFAGIDTIASGDDMLLMHKIFKSYPDKVLFLKDKEAIVQTQPMQTWKSFFNQRIRWASKADKYNDKRILPVLILVYFFNLLLFLLPVLALFQNQQFHFCVQQFSLFQYWFLFLILKTVVELYFLYPVAKFFDKQKSLWWFPFAQPFHILYTIIAGWLGKFGSYQWKDRKVK